MVTRETFKTREEWLKKRTSFIGGSDASCILGMNHWKTNVDLWKEKTGRKKKDDISDNPLVKYGTDAEAHLRELFKLDFPQLSVSYEEHNMWLNSSFPWAHASLDGWLTDESGRLGILEIKTSNIMNSAQKEQWQDRIPDSYYCQLLHYFMVTDAQFAVLKAQLKFGRGDDDLFLQTKHYFLERSDCTMDIIVLEEAEKEFMNYITQGIQPPLKLPEI